MNRWLFILFIIKVISAGPTPVVLWHGMGDTCCMPYSLGYIKHFLEQQIPGVYVHSIRVGDNTVEDLENSYFMSPNEQVQDVCDMLVKDPKLQSGFNAIGFSQGSQFLRALVQRCGHKLPPIKNLITLGGQHQGVYGLPHCGAIQHRSCDYVRKLLNYAAYYSWVQNSLVQATYWHDPLDEKTYKKKSEFLADINNEVTINQTYIDNLNSLENLVLVKFTNDSIVQPRETEWFGFYAPGQAKKLQKLQETELYLQDRLGLKKMNEAGKLVFLSLPGDHLQFTQDWFINVIIKKYLNPAAE
ncbi:palmitoyl-protein thioesterase 1 [Ostrinia nubilalis]|uniref:palmitoyl-protein thioesterase 1 n=1 Tax=Ostrinia nubilalis TaxID=29057 RepID=UPI00103C86D4|nr:palmitoyl-protein thioesterase 1 isoform X2 [Ostrinia furnacalis]XP_028170289.1 palmitoyl-protein thioesterase 1 isoform X3 [Ostrinia furnacalis]